jgi:hypothetical protein
MAYSADNPLGLEASELAASNRAKAAAAARAAKIAKPGAFMNTPGYQAGSGSEMDQFMMENATLLAEANAGLAEIDAANKEADDLLASIGTPDAAGNIVSSDVVAADAAELEGDKTLVVAGLDPTFGGKYPAWTQGTVNKIVGAVAPVIDPALKDAYALLEDAFNQYGLGDLASVIKGYMEQGIGPNEAKLLLRQNPIYQQRFAGLYDKNFGRIANGLNAISEAEYLALENSYNETLNAYGLSDYFGKDAKSKQAGMAAIIGGDVSASEFANRVKLAQDQVVNADPQIMATLKQFYPSISDTDLLKYYLDPKQNLAALTEKTTAAQIGTAAIEQGLGTNVTSATDLAKYGITQSQAQSGYAKIGELLPTATKLSGIYGEANVGYNQATAEEEIFKGSASAQRKRQQLSQLEQAAFNGRSGINTTVNPLGKGLQGSF